MRIIFNVLFISVLSSCKTNCPESFNESDSLSLEGDLKLYSGSEDGCPVVFVMKGEDYSTTEYIVEPSLLKNESYLYGKIFSSGHRIAILYIHQSEGDNSAISFILSNDNGENWITISADQIDTENDGIRSIDLSDANDIIVKLYKLDTPNTYLSKDNGKTWSPLK